MYTSSFLAIALLSFPFTIAAPSSHLLPRRHADTAPAVPRSPERVHDTSINVSERHISASSSSSSAPEPIAHIIHPEDDDYRSYFYLPGPSAPVEQQQSGEESKRWDMSSMVFAAEEAEVAWSLEAAELAKEVIKESLQASAAPVETQSQSQTEPEIVSVGAVKEKAVVVAKPRAGLSKSRSRMGKRACAVPVKTKRGETELQHA